MLRMQEVAFPAFKFQNVNFLGEYAPDPLFMRGMSATHVAFSHCYPPNILSYKKVPFQKMPPPPWKSP
jgi:hypothetical protein